ncbi:MAG: glutamate racemase [Pseudobdellovibrio sp.]
MSFDNRPIGVFDSGIGGITVLRELVKKFPKENFIYLGDTARLPYGSKSPETVRKYSVQIMKYLISRDVKAIIVACNTASTQVPELSYEGRNVYNVIDPGAELAANKTENKKIAVLGTRATIRAGSYAKKIKKYLPDATVYSQACPLFVPLAEEAWYEDPVTNIIAFRYLQHLKAAEVDTVVMGCTHYPLLKSSIRKVFGNYVHLIDSGEAIALLLESDFKAGRLKPASNLDKSSLIVALTDYSEQFENHANELLCTVMSGQIDFETVSVS